MDFRVPVSMQDVLREVAQARGLSLKGEMMRRLRLTLTADELALIDDDTPPRKRKRLRHGG